MTKEFSAMFLKKTRQNQFLWKELKTWKVGSNTLVTYTYGANNGNLLTTTYGENGMVIENVYDRLDRVTEIKYNGISKYQYWRHLQSPKRRYKKNFCKPYSWKNFY